MRGRGGNTTRCVARVQYKHTTTHDIESQRNPKQHLSQNLKIVTWGQPITHEQLKHFIQPSQYGHSHSKHDAYLRGTSNTYADLDGVYHSSSQQDQLALKRRLLESQQVSRIEENVYIYSFSLSPSRPELNHGAVSITELHGFELLVDIPNTGLSTAEFSAGDTQYELLVITNNRGLIRTDVLSNNLLGLQELKEQ